MATLEKPFEKVRHKLVAARIEVMAQLAKFSLTELTLAPAPHVWSALEVAYHVYLVDGVMLEQLRLVQEEDDPLIANLGDDQHLAEPSEPPASLDAVLAGMAARREELFEYLSALPSEAWERPLRHPTFGPLKFYQMVNVLPQHDQTHARQLIDVKAALAPTQP